ncbi:MAG: TldD/PmbA family protein [Nitrososphaerales archaeon]
MIELLNFAIDKALSLGSEYAEARLHTITGEGMNLKNGQIEPGISIDSRGIGLRIIKKGALAFGSTNLLKKESISSIIEELSKQAESSLNTIKEKVELSDFKAEKANWSCEEKEKLEDVGVDRMVTLLKDLDSNIIEGAKGFPYQSRILSVSKSVEEKEYLNSEGSYIRSRVPRVGFTSYLSGVYDGESFTVTIPPGYSKLGWSGGWERIERGPIFELTKEKAYQLTKILASKVKMDSESVDVILGPLISGLAAHESVGHPQEADRILGREAAQAGESYLNPEDLGKRVGSEQATVIDDPTLEGSSGYYLYDDEGVKAKKRVLMDKGIVREFLHNRATSKKFGTLSNAASRANSFNREPIVRMANTYVEKGDHSLDELIKGVRKGILMESFMEWNIDDKRYNQRYVGLECYKIEGGELKEPLKHVVLEITTPKFWSSIDAKGKKLEFVTGMCGKGDPLQGIPVWTGGPHLRLRGVRVWQR